MNMGIINTGGGPGPKSAVKLLKFDTGLYYRPLPVHFSTDTHAHYN